MDTKKILGIIFSLIFVGAFAFVLVWGITNFNKVQEGISGTGLYSQEDLNNAYQDGYDTALTNKNEYEELINSYRDTITTQTDQISQLNSQITILNNGNADYENRIASLNSTILAHEQSIVSLQTTISGNQSTITSLETEITNKNKEIANLEEEIELLESTDTNQKAEIANKQNQINSLNNQIANMQNLVNQLNATNDLNLQTIATLNSQIQTQNAQISELKLQISNNNTNVTDLQNQIADLQKSVAYYEQYIANLENETQVVATFEFDGSVYNIQVLSVGDYASVTTPTSTDYVIFNGWAVDGMIVDLATYPINENTKFVADVTYKYDVQFIVENEVVSSQLVEKDTIATLPEEPTKDGYYFDGWSIDGVNAVDASSYQITENTTFKALFAQNFTVTFVYEDETISTQTVKGGTLAENVEVESTIYKVFNGWLLNGTSVDITTYKIVADTTFVADISYYQTVEFMVDDEVYNTQLVQKDGYVNMPENPTTTDYFVFNGWLLNGESIDVSTYQITADTIFIADVTHKYDVKYYVDGELYQSIIVAEGGYATNYGVGKTGYDHIGWTVDGVNIVTISAYPITENTTFNAVFEIATYTLTVNYMNGTESTTYSATMGETYTLSTPTLEGYNFVEWRIASGGGSISGNKFTFGGSDATVYACYDYCQTTITYWTTGTVVYEGTTHTMEGQGGGSSGGSGGAVFCSTDVSTMAYVSYADTLNLDCDVSDSLTVTIDSGTMLLTITTDGEYTRTKNSSTSYTITWTNASYMNIVVKVSSVVLL